MTRLEQIKGMGRDSKGVDRGRCSKPGCPCIQFLYKKEEGPKCSNCGHVPVSHTEIREAVLIEPFNDSSGFASEEEGEEETVEGAVNYPSRRNMDIRGIVRGKCTNPRCNCKQFSYIKAQGPKCSVCGHAPTKHTEIKTSGQTSHRVDEEEDELENDSALFKPRNNMPSTPSKMFSSISISSSDLHITDMEDPIDSYNPNNSLSVDSSKQVPADGYSLQSGVPKRPKTQSAIDSSMVPVFPTDGNQLGSMSLVQTNPAYQGIHSRGGYISQQPQPFASMPAMPTNITVPTAVHVQHSITTPQVTPRPSVQSAQKTCKVAGCNKPVHVEANGRVHDFCGRRHAAEFNSAGVPPHLKCSNPSCKRMRFQENGVYLDYCGKSCRDSYRKSQEPQLLPGNTCKLPGCKKAKYFDPQRNSYLDYCGQAHANEARKQLIRKANKHEFDRIKGHFTSWWDHRKGNCGQVCEVLVIENQNLKDQFTKYHSSLSVKTVKQYYHGTSLKCAIYQNATVCSDGSCGICGVSQKGMRCDLRTSNITFQRFGNGFYLAPNSSKCHDYTQGHDKYRAMLLFDVAEGNKYVVTNDQTNLKAPPKGYDSVYGQRGGSLNYDEIVLYKSEALLPTHIVVYMKDGIHKIAK